MLTHQAITPCVVLAVSIAFGVKTASRRIASIVTVISFGVFTASYGEVDFNGLGVAIQLLAILVESCRLVLIQVRADQAASCAAAAYGICCRGK